MLSLWYLIPGGLLSIIAVVGNGLVIYLIVRRKRLHTTANWFILSLAIADFFVGASYLLAENLCDVYACDHQYVRQAVVSFLSAASATNLCLMTLDRYIAIVKPLKYITFMTTRRVVLLISTVWLASFLTHFIILLKYVISPTPHDVRSFTIFDIVVFEILPLVTLLPAAGHVFFIARRHSHQRAVLMAQLRFNQRIEHSKILHRQTRVNSSAKLVGVAVTVFTICYVYELYYTAVHEISWPTQSHLYLFYLSSLLYLVHSAFNPVAYAFFKSDIKKSLINIFRCNEASRERRGEQSHERRIVKQKQSTV